MTQITYSNSSNAASPIALLRTFRTHTPLLRRMVRRDVSMRYSGSAFGLLWSFITPLLMLAVYTFVFGIIFKARFGTAAVEEENTAAFAVTLFCGLIIHQLMGDIITRAPGIILQHTNYVKKVVFPLEILPVMVCGSALFHFCMNMVVLLAALLLMNHAIPLTVFYVPLILLPFVFMLVGASWVLASLGVYLRDIGQIMGLVSTLLLFLSPIFYPASSLPEEFRHLLYLNPLTYVIEMMRGALLYAHAPDWYVFALATSVSIVCAWAGYAWFQKTRKGFADIL